MIVYHGAYDLDTYWGVAIDVRQGAWLWLARITATLFLLVSGMVVCVSEERMLHAPRHERIRRRLRRALVTGMAAALVTLITFLVEPDTYVRFGILHLFTLSRLLLPLTHRFGTTNIACGLLVITVGSLGPWETQEPWLLAFGAYPSGFASVDYYPLLPWYGVALIGMGLMHGGRMRAWCSVGVHPALLPLQWAGRHSLIVYLAHQPLLLSILMLLLGNPYSIAGLSIGDA